MNLNQQKLKHNYRFRSKIQVPFTEVKFKGVEKNMCSFWKEPVLPHTANNYTWKTNYSMSIDIDCSKKYDEICCYINADLFMKDEKYFLIKINTLHTYHTPKLGYHFQNAELIKQIVRESAEHANRILKIATAQTAYKHFMLPDVKEKWLSTWAHKKIKEYIPFAERKWQIPVLTQQEKDANLSRINELVAWIDNYTNEEITSGKKHTPAKKRIYNRKFAEWSRLYKVMINYKLIAGNQVVYHLIDALARMEKARQTKKFTPEANSIYKLLKAELKSIQKQLAEVIKSN